MSLADQRFYRDEHLLVDLRQQLVMLDGATVSLTPMQYHLLVLLVEHAGEVLPRATLLRHVWGDPPEMRSRTLDAQVRGLRRKLGVYAFRYIEMIMRVGYRFQPAPEP